MNNHQDVMTVCLPIVLTTFVEGFNLSCLEKKKITFGFPDVTRALEVAGALRLFSTVLHLGYKVYLFVAVPLSERVNTAT